MAWPCITRACCINRFWSELDKADIAVPLVFTKYSDVAEVQHLHPQPPSRQTRTGPITIETQPSHSEQEAAAVKAPPATGAASGKHGCSASVMRQDFREWKDIRPEPSCKPKNEYHPSATPFHNVTQYQKDYKPWPVPKKGDHPWIPKPSPTASFDAQERGVGTTTKHATTEHESGVEKSEIEEKVQEKVSKERKKKPVKKEKTVEKKVSAKMEGQPPADVTVEGKGRAAADALNRQIKHVVSTGTGSSYRNEFKAYKDVKPVKSTKPQSQYKPPTDDKDKSSLETSYSATYKGEQAKVQPTDNKLLERRRIRSLYNEPGGKETTKVDKTKTKPKKTTTTSKMVKKVKEKTIAGALSTKKKTSTSTKPDESKLEGGVISKKSKEISNRLAEAKK
ncbi:microtubule-associated protein 6 homolog [Oncorhynchus keta]|uniref:microtubule-associated protein 6 homolog n=1 Tax=Oncorhynchus keta TaxID=8018 RepID=UPI0015FA18C4|nr:microtubule-associated protein 6 homolog [Oncorhynchus keta]